MIDGRLLTEKIVTYAKLHLHLGALDEVYVRNSLLFELKLEDPLDTDEVPDLSYIADLKVPDSIYSEIKQYAVENNIVEEPYADIYATYIMGLVSPRPSDVNNVFNTLKERLGPQSACSYLFDLSIKNNYIQKTAIDRNILWEYKDGNNKLEITINLSKPEKDNKDIAKLLHATAQKNKKYPKCLLCRENEGFKGTLTHPARGNLRIISLKLAGEEWFMQYSPYQYYEEHCIVFGKHVPMSINRKTIEKLCDFIELFPNYFIGSNADLPIVGGSILNHEHFQGGKHLMPMHHAGVIKEFKSEEYPDVEIGLLDWYNTVIHLTGFNRNTVVALAGDIIEKWETYSDESANIIGKTEDGVRHNTVTPSVRFTDDNRYCIDLILRNNMTSEQYPDGIYHAHPEYHNIKKEGIGLIEAMGLYILPGRLKKQMSDIQDILTKKVAYDRDAIFTEGNPLYVHRYMIDVLVKQHPVVNSAEEAQQITTDYINHVCAKILDNTSVYKKDAEGNLALTRFLDTLGIK